MSRATSKSRGLTAKQVRELLAQTPPPEQDEEIAGLAVARAYRFADGRALVVAEDGKGRLHESRAVLLALLRAVDARTPVSPFGELLPQGRRFADEAVALAVEFAVANGLPSPAEWADGGRAAASSPGQDGAAADGLSSAAEWADGGRAAASSPGQDGAAAHDLPSSIADAGGGAAAAAGGPPTSASLPDLDSIVRRLGAAACRKPPVFAQLVAYVGQTLIAARGGGWQMRLASDGTAWEPWIVDGAGRQVAPFGLVYKEIADWGPASSLTGAVSGSLRPLQG